MRERFSIAAALLLAALGATGCGSVGLGPQKEAPAVPDKGSKAELYEVDLSKPEGPMYQMLRAAQERDEEMFKQALAPDADVAMVDEIAFRSFRKKVLTNKITPVPESVQQVSDTEAVVKLRNARGREIPVHVRKFGEKWLVTGIELGEKARDRFRERNPEAGPPAQQSGPPSAPSAS